MSMGRKEVTTKQKTCGDYGGETALGAPCQHLAGWGTQHQGEGKCNQHNGVALAKMQAIKNDFLNALREGVSGTVTEASRVAGIDFATIWRWQRADPVFDEMVKTVEAEVDEIRTKKVKKSLYLQALDVEGPPTSKIFWLKNKAPDEFADVQRQAFTDPTGKEDKLVKFTIEIDHQGNTEED